MTRRDEALTYIKDVCMPLPWHKSICVNNSSIGFVAVFVHEGHKANIGYCVARKYWGQGIATQALKMSVKMVLQDFPEINTQSRNPNITNSTSCDMENTQSIFDAKVTIRGTLHTLTSIKELLGQSVNERRRTRVFPDKIAESLKKVRVLELLELIRKPKMWSALSDEDSVNVCLLLKDSLVIPRGLALSKIGNFEKGDYGALFAEWSNPILYRQPNGHITASPNGIQPIICDVVVHEPQSEQQSKEVVESVPLFTSEELVAEYHSITTSVQLIENVGDGDPSIVLKELAAIKQKMNAIERFIKFRNDNLSEDSVAKQSVKKKLNLLIRLPTKLFNTQLNLLKERIESLISDVFHSELLVVETSKNEALSEEFDPKEYDKNVDDSGVGKASESKIINVLTGQVSCGKYVGGFYEYESLRLYYTDSKEYLSSSMTQLLQAAEYTEFDFDNPENDSLSDMVKTGEEEIHLDGLETVDDPFVQTPNKQNYEVNENQPPSSEKVVEQLMRKRFVGKDLVEPYTVQPPTTAPSAFLKVDRKRLKRKARLLQIQNTLISFDDDVGDEDPYFKVLSLEEWESTKMKKRNKKEPTRQSQIALKEIPLVEFTRFIMRGDIPEWVCNGVRYPVMWADVEQVFFSINEPKKRFCLDVLHIRTDVITLKDVPIQGDAYGDCGVWVCIFLYRLIHKMAVSAKDPQIVRLAYREHMFDTFGSIRLLIRANEGTVTHIHTNADGRFETLYVGFGFSIRSFLRYMRPLIIIDGAHLKGNYLGTNLLAVGMDGNNQIITLATCIDMPPLSKLVASKAYTTEDFDKAISKLRGHRPEVVRKLEESCFEKCSRAYCPRSRYNYMTSNSVESINSLTRIVRSIPITMLVEYCQDLLQRWYCEKRHKYEEAPENELCEWAATKVYDRMLKSANWTPNQRRKSIHINSLIRTPTREEHLLEEDRLDEKRLRNRQVYMDWDDVQASEEPVTTTEGMAVEDWQAVQGRLDSYNSCINFLSHTENENYYQSQP
nr:hypothetical protein [Tanacetum cinerariifolium]